MSYPLYLPRHDPESPGAAWAIKVHLEGRPGFDEYDGLPKDSDTQMVVHAVPVDLRPGLRRDFSASENTVGCAVEDPMPACAQIHGPAYGSNAQCKLQSCPSCRICYLCLGASRLHL